MAIKSMSGSEKETKKNREREENINIKYYDNADGNEE